MTRLQKIKMYVRRWLGVPSPSLEAMYAAETWFFEFRDALEDRRR